MKRSTLLAIGLVAASISAPALFRWYSVTREPEADLVISGRPLESAPLPSASPAAASLPAANAQPAPKPVEETKLVIHVAGAVKKSGVYKLPVGARCDDAVKAAGGATKDAYLDGINLAARVEDGQQLYVPNKSDRSENSGAVSSASRSSSSRPDPAKPQKFVKPGDGTVDLNTASVEQLQRLPGVGPATAERIVAHRKENGGFRQIEDLMDIPRIGEKTFERLRPFLRVK